MPGYRKREMQIFGGCVASKGKTPGLGKEDGRVFRIGRKEAGRAGAGVERSGEGF